MALVEESDDVVAGLPLGHGGTDRDDGAGAVGAGHDGRLLAEDVFTLLCWRWWVSKIATGWCTGKEDTWGMIRSR